MEVGGFVISNKYIYLLLTIIMGLILYSILGKLVNKILLLRTKRFKIDKRKSKTLQVLFNNILKYIIFIIVLITLLGFLGVDSTALIASVGVFSLVIGLALQDVLKDLLAGIFILFEDQYAVGDVVEVTGFRGEIISLGLRSTKIRSFLGETKIIANRNISEVINYSLHDSLAIIDINVAYDTDLELADKVFNNLTTKLSKKITNLSGDFEFWGIQNLGYYITYRMAVKTKPLEHFEVKRKALKEIKKELDNNNIKRN